MEKELCYFRKKTDEWFGGKCMKKRENTRTSSIAWRINAAWVRKQFFSYLWMDIMITALVIGCWCCAAEWGFFGSFHWNRVERFFDMRDGMDGILYIVTDFSGRTLRQDAGQLFVMLTVCAAAIAAIQLMSLVHNIIFGARYVRYKLQPLNEMAKKAEELSSIAFDESKFHLLEDAISNVNPESGDEHVKIGDKELKGLELAVNNLIDRMRESYRQQSRFVSDASHELRTPISVIQGYANMLDRWGKEDENVLEEGIEAIKHESEHMSTLVEQLLFLARSDSGKNKMVRESVPIGPLVKEVYEESIMIDGEHQYSFRELTKEDVALTGDSTMLKQAIRILADNAMKYTKERDEIIFAYGKAGSEVFFYVQDSGAGMREQDIEHIFERFYRSEQARNGSTEGSGLGLSIAKWIVDKHRGHFEILSREGIGTRLTVWLPYQ